MSISTTYTYLPQSFAGEIRQVSLSLLLLLYSYYYYPSRTSARSHKYLPSSAARFLHLTHHKRIADAYNIRNK